MESEFSIKIPMFGKNKYPMVRFKDVDFELETEHSIQRYKAWKDYQPEKRISAVEWRPTFLAISEHEYDREGD
jgi:hypothetical protein